MKKTLDLPAKIREMEIINQGESQKAFWADESAVVDVEINPQDKARVIEGDSEPMFVTVEVLNENTSKNGNRYTKDAIMQVYDQIVTNKPLGYLGHLKPDDESTKAPKPVTIWLGATVKTLGEKLRLFAKGYVMPNAVDFRELLKKAHAVNKEMAVSIYGKGLRHKEGDHYRIDDFDLESIDWVRDGQNSVPFAGLWNLTQEMVVKGEDRLTQITLDDLKKHRPDLILALYDETKTELMETVKEQTQQAIDETKHKIELEAQIASLKIETKANQLFPKPTVRGIITESINRASESGVSPLDEFEAYCKTPEARELMRLKNPHIFSPRVVKIENLETGRYTK